MRLPRKTDLPKAKSHIKAKGPARPGRTAGAPIYARGPAPWRWADVTRMKLRPGTADWSWEAVVYSSDGGRKKILFSLVERDFKGEGVPRRREPPDTYPF
jgi:hypothetical protein